MRTKLICGEQILLTSGNQEYQYTIESVIGDGASCIAYNAYRITPEGARKNFRIKECYPHGAEIERAGTELIWRNATEQEESFHRFEEMHRLLAELKNNENVGNHITNAELFRGNGTLYSVMEVNHALTYDKDATKDLHRILNTMLVLAKLTAKIHEAGYLHLDLKPENFLVSYEPSIMMWLFDTDSFVSLQELKNGTLKQVPYSQSWAAPEQIRGQINKIDARADIYSIGAILFAKVMGRRATNDDMGLFADWHFDQEIFEDNDPKIKRLLREIFKKTLSANVNRRYACINELIAALTEAVKVTAFGRPYLMTNCPHSTVQFVGREQELSQIRKVFTSGSPAVFLHGVGGIGKSEVAKKYAETFANEYDAVLFLRYVDSLERSFDEIEIQNFDDNDIQEHRRVLHRLLNKQVLLIIDNFDVEVNADEYLEQALSCGAQVLITTRTDFSMVYADGIRQVDIDSLAQVELQHLFMKHAGNEAFLSEDMDLLSKLLKQIEYHTYAAELLAKQMHSSGWSMQKLYDKWQEGLASFEDAERIRAAKDGRIYKKTLPDIMRVVFRISDLSGLQKTVLCNFSLLNFIHVTKENYRTIAIKKSSNQQQEQMNALDDLLELGWIKYSNNTKTMFTLHALVNEVVKNDLKPSLEKCQGIRQYVRNNVLELNMHDDTSLDARQDENEFKSKFLCYLLLNLNSHSEEYLSLVFDWLLERTDCYGEKINEIPRIDEKPYSALYDQLIQHSNSGCLDSSSYFKACFILYQASLKMLELIYFDEVANQKYSEKRNKAITESFDRLCFSLDSLDSETKNQAKQAIAEITAEYFGSKNFMPCCKSVVKWILNNCPGYEFSLYDKKKLGLPLSEEEKHSIKERQEQDRLWRLQWEKEKGRNYDYDEVYRQFIATLQKSSDKITVLNEFAENASYFLYDRMEMIEDFTDRLYVLRSPVIRTGYTWEEAKEIFTWELNFLDDHIEEALKLAAHEQEDWFYWRNECHYRLAVANAVLGTQEDYQKHIEPVFENAKRHLAASFSMGILGINFQRMVDCFLSLNKASILIPYFVDLFDLAEESPNPQIYDFYKIAHSVSEAASEESGLSVECYAECHILKKKSKQKMDEYLNVDFDFKEKE